MTVRTPRELIEIYWDRVYNAGEVELIREVCADPIIRHDPDTVLPLSHDEQIERVTRSLRIEPYFTHRVLHADDRFVTSVWNMTSRNGAVDALCGIEVFEAEDGRFTRCWNSTYMKGFWGEDGDDFDPARLEPPPLLETPGEITADWFIRALAAGGVVTPQPVATAPVITPIGHGTSSQTAHVHVGYNVGTITAPSDVVCKFGKLSIEGLGTVSAFERERLAFELFGSDPPFRTPRMLYGATGGDGLTNLILDDLSDRTRPGDQIAGCSIADARAVVAELARFHAAYWRQEDKLALTWLSRREAMEPLYHKGVARMREWLSDRIAAEDIALAETFGSRVGDWLAAPHPDATLIHTDARVDNVLFEDTGDGPLAWLIDWQCIGAGDPQYDLAYFLSGSVSPEDRRECERDLVAEHSAVLQAIDPAQNSDQALESYRRNIASGLWLTVIAASATEKSEHNSTLIATLMERNCIAMRDWDVLRAF